MIERIEVPQCLMCLIADIIQADKLQNSIVGKTEDDFIRIDVSYTERQVDSIAEIARIIEKYVNNQN